MLRRLEKGHGSDQPFSPGGAAYLPRSDSGAAGGVQNGGEQGNSRSGDRYGLVEVYEWFAAEYGWSPRFIDDNLTDEQFALYTEKAAKRRQAQAFLELDRIVSGTSWGVGIAFDQKGRAARKWDRIRNKQLGAAGRSPGMTGAALEQAVMAIASADPSLVKIQGAT